MEPPKTTLRCQMPRCIMDAGFKDCLPRGCQPVKQQPSPRGCTQCRIFGAILERLECLDLAYSADQGHHFPSCCQESRDGRMVREFTTVISGIPRSHQQPQVGVAHLTKLW